MDIIVKEMLEKFTFDLESIFKKPLKELTLHGSIVDGGFVPGKGDIDFIAFVDHEITAEMFTALTDYHRKLRLSDGLEKQLEGSYLVINESEEFANKGVYIGTGEKGWKCFEGDLFSEIDKAHIQQAHYEHKESGITNKIFTYDWEKVKTELTDQIKKNAETVDQYEDWDYRLHLLHTTARSLYTLEHRSFISKYKALEWLETRTAYSPYSDYIRKYNKFKSVLSQKEKLELDAIGYEPLRKMLLIGNNKSDVITINETIRLKSYNGEYLEALPWYQDEFVYYNSEGITDKSKIPDVDYMIRMYSYLDEHSELYFIEALEDGTYVKIGDVAIQNKNLPIVIGVAKYRGKGIARLVMQAAFKRLKELGYSEIKNSIIYEYNTSSQKLHESLGYIHVDTKGIERIYEKQL